MPKLNSAQINNIQLIYFFLTEPQQIINYFLIYSKFKYVFDQKIAVYSCMYYAYVLNSLVFQGLFFKKKLMKYLLIFINFAVFMRVAGLLLSPYICRSKPIKPRNMKKYVIYLGLISNTGTALNIERVMDVIKTSFAAKGIESFNIVSAQGYWLGAPEPCLIITSINGNGIQAMKLICANLKTLLYQDAVALEYTDVNFELI